jgi:predicted O-linked N-acetylglucosamine transferase (SPINDLY family)
MDHTQGALLIGVMTQLDPTRFQSHILFLNKGPPQVLDTPSLKTHVFPVGTGVAEVIPRLAGLELDVLVFNDVNMEPVTYLAAFSRVAHVQCLTLNNGITSGITDSVDFVISSALHQPPGAQAQYTEELLLLPTSHTYYTPDEPIWEGHGLLSRADLGLPDRDWRQGGPVLVVCVQALMKVHVTMDDAMVDVVLSRPRVHGDGGAVLVLLSKGKDVRVRALAARLGLNAQRRYGVPLQTFVDSHVVGGDVRWPGCTMHSHSPTHTHASSPSPCLS